MFLLLPNHLLWISGISPNDTQNDASFAVWFGFGRLNLRGMIFHIYVRCRFDHHDHHLGGFWHYSIGVENCLFSLHLNHQTATAQTFIFRPINNKIVGVQSRNKCSLWNVERKDTPHTPTPPHPHTSQTPHTPHTPSIIQEYAQFCTILTKDFGKFMTWEATKAPCNFFFRQLDF
jgi:hypothetical protein